MGEKFKNKNKLCMLSLIVNYRFQMYVIALSLASRPEIKFLE